GSRSAGDGDANPIAGAHKLLCLHVLQQLLAQRRAHGSKDSAPLTVILAAARPKLTPLRSWLNLKGALHRSTDGNLLRLRDRWRWRRPHLFGIAFSPSRNGAHRA